MIIIRCLHSIISVNLRLALNGHPNYKMTCLRQSEPKSHRFESGCDWKVLLGFSFANSFKNSVSNPDQDLKKGGIETW